MSSIKYRPEIDGLRAIAVIGVILFHMDYSFVSGGYLGVDVFFVISGYLITSIILKEANEGRFQFKNFWIRRIKRILPALVAVSSVVSLVMLIFGFRGYWRTTGEQLLAAILSYSNIYYWKFTGDYWGPDAEGSPFLHTWSLAIEEQFYLFLPLLLVFVIRYFPKRTMSILGLFFVISLGLFMFAYTLKPTATFYLLPTRAWELGIGCILAGVHQAVPKSGSEKLSGLGLLGLCLIGLGFILGPEFGPVAVIPVAGSVLVIAFGGSGLVKKLLGNNAMRSIGLISYSLYLCHWPLIVLPEKFETEIHDFLYLVLSFASALLLHYTVEKPARHGKLTVPFSIGSIGALAALACFMIKASPQYDRSEFDENTILSGNFAVNPDKNENRNLYLEGGMIIPEGEIPNIVLYGDSHGAMWSQQLARLAVDREEAVSLNSMTAVSPFFYPEKKSYADVAQNALSEKEYTRWASSKISYLEQWKPEVVVIIAKWSHRTDQVREIERMVDYVSRAAKKVIIIGQPPLLDTDNVSTADYLLYKGYEIEGEITLGEKEKDLWKKGEDMVAGIAPLHENVLFVSIADLYRRDGDRVVVCAQKNLLYKDDDHITDYGASIAYQRLVLAFENN